METPFIVGEKIYFRPLERSDLKTCQGWLNNPEVTRFITSGRFPMTELGEAEFLESLHKTQDRLAMGICLKENDQLIGSGGLHNIKWIDRAATLGIIIGEPDCWEQGYGTEATGLIVDYAFQKLNMNRVDLDVFDFNERAISCYEKVGFIQECRMRQAYYKNGRYCDCLIMSILREEWEKQKD